MDYFTKPDPGGVRFLFAIRCPYGCPKSIPVSMSVPAKTSMLVTVVTCDRCQKEAAVTYKRESTGYVLFVDQHSKDG